LPATILLTSSEHGEEQMPALLLKLIPFRDYAYAALFVAAVVWYNVHVHNLNVAYAAKQETALTSAIAAANTKADAAAKTKLDKLTADYNAAIVTIGENYAKAMQSADAAHDADTKRLQLRAASASGGASNTGVGSAAAQASAADAGTISARALGVVPAERALDLADALRADDAALVQCYADRDSLTGK
jgi:hypothetical protein